MAAPFTPPRAGATAFHCTHCAVYANQNWGPPAAMGSVMAEYKVARCAHCSKYSVFFNDRLVHPLASSAPLANDDLPDSIKADFEEARHVLPHSPRASAALLRLAIQRLCQHLGQKGENLNADIGTLVKRGLSPKVQRALDVVRVVGNNAVHPGQIELKDDTETAEALFGLVNLIADVMISQPKHVDALYATLPETARAQIEKRDGPKEG
jgi:hypothetical protein